MVVLLIFPFLLLLLLLLLLCLLPSSQGPRGPGFVEKEDGEEGSPGGEGLGEAEKGEETGATTLPPPWLVGPPAMLCEQEGTKKRDEYGHVSMSMFMLRGATGAQASIQIHSNQEKAKEWTASLQHCPSRPARPAPD